MRKTFSLLFILSAIGCAHAPGPLIEDCLLNTMSSDPAQWYGACQTKDSQSVVRKPFEMNKYVCAPADDFQAVLQWAHRK